MKLNKLTMLLLSALAAQAALAVDFTEGVLTFSVLSETNRTCAVKKCVETVNTDVVIPSTVTRGTDEYTVTAVADSAFNGCTKMPAVTIPNTVTRIGISSFQICRKLKKVEIPGSVTTIGKHAFYRVDEMTRVILNEGLQSIGESAFEGSSSLEYVNLPSTVREIGASAFSGTRIRKITIPEGVRELKTNLFNWCTYLETIDLPSSIVSIAGGVFCDTYYQSGKRAQVTCRAGYPPICDPTAFDMETTSSGVKEYYSANIIIPETSKALYLSAPVWSQMEKLIKTLPPAPLTVALEHGTIEFANAQSFETPLKLTASDGWEINNVALGGEEITLADDGSYIVPVLSEGKTLTVVYKQNTPSAVDEVAAEQSDVKVFVDGDCVRVEGAPADAEVNCFNTNGRCLLHTRDHSFSLDASGVVLINVGGSTYKFFK